ncbi:MAG: hypothetical protein RL641_628 [Candidatus Parcubacteria bacterium]|jgi:pimeloyl-ACP methyl ester carboxylesterase
MLFKSVNFTQSNDEETCVDIYEASEPINLKLIALHGAGKSDRNRCRAICSAFAKVGISSIAPDLSGAGNSKHIKPLTLNHRLQTAIETIDSFIPQEGKFIVAAFSMSGQTAIDLSIKYGKRMQCLILFSPAIYSIESIDKPFGDAFSSVIRKENSWMNSSAPNTLKQFDGNVLLVTPDNDTVIPKGVFDIIKHSVNKDKLKEIVFNDAPHTLGSWLNENPTHAEYITKETLLCIQVS